MDDFRRACGLRAARLGSGPIPTHSNGEGTRRATRTHQCHAGSSQAVAVPANRQNRRRACRAASGQAPREGSDQASSEGVRPREDYLASLPSRQRPWEAESISRRTWERRRSKRVASPLPTIVSNTGSPLATRCKVESQRRGYQAGAGVSAENKATKVEEEENESSCSSHPVTHLRQPEFRECSRAAWTKPTILSDEPRDFSEFPLKTTAAA